jgi:membrane protease YdiL (CAAX protease family)
MAARSAITPLKHAWLVLELGALYVTLPVLMWLGVVPYQWRMPVLVGAFLAAAGVCYVLGVRRGQLGMGNDAVTARGLIIGLVVFGIVFVGWVVLLSLMGRAPLPMIRTDPGLLLMIVCFYWISALAQEFLFRSFFFWRYRRLLPGGAMILANAAVFAFVHIVYGQWLSVVLSFPVGLLLAWMYARHPSLIAVTVTHYLFGLLAFAGGLGGYFYRG